MKLVVKVGAKVLTSLPEEGAIEGGATINAGEEKSKARKKLIVKLGGKVLTSLPEEGAIEGGATINAGKEKSKARKKLIVKVGGKVLTPLPEEGAIEGGGTINAGKEKSKARKKLIVKLGGKVLTPLPEEGAIEGGAIKHGAGREKLSALKVPLPPSQSRTPRTSKKKKSSSSAEKKKVDMEAVKMKPQTLREKMEAFYESWETEDYYDGDGGDYEDRYYRHLNQQLSTTLHDGDRCQPAAEKMERPRQSTALVSTNDDFVIEKIVMKNKKRKLMQESETRARCLDLINFFAFFFL